MIKIYCRIVVGKIESELGDIFHMQQELTRATAGPLNAQLNSAEKIYEKNCQKTASSILEIKDAKTTELASLKNLEECKQRKDKVKQAKKAMSEAYHPFDLNTGQSKTSEEISAELEIQYSVIIQIANEAKLSEKCHERLEKAHRVFKKMIGTLNFFWETVKIQIESLNLSIELEELMHQLLIPLFYLQMAAKKAKGAKRRQEIFACVQTLKDRLEQSIWGTLEVEQRKKIESTAKYCAQLFQRSSSCVEGRNGYLSLRHHGLHHLSDRKLKVLTVLHNYYNKRSDGSTAAERFFESKPKDLFQWLLKRLPMPARPVAKHSINTLVEKLKDAA